MLAQLVSLAESVRAQLLADCIKEHGAASFFDELMDISGLLRSQVEEALAELVALGLVTSDSFGGLRATGAVKRTADRCKWTKAPAHHLVRDRECGPLGDGPALCRGRTQR